MNTSWAEPVTIILSICSVVGPLVFGFILWKMSQLFISKQEFSDYKAQNKTNQEDINKLLQTIQIDLHRLNIGAAIIQTKMGLPSGAKNNDDS